MRSLPPWRRWRGHSRTLVTTWRRARRRSTPTSVADAIAVLHTVSNAELHAFATAHLGREPQEDEFEAEQLGDDPGGLPPTTGVAYDGAIGAVHAQTRRFAAGM